MSNVHWTLYAHPKNGALKVVVGYAALNSRANDVLVIIPLYDLRDTNHDGSVSVGETLLPWVPFVGGAVTPMQEAELMMQIGVDLHDPGLVQKARMRALGTAFEAADKAFRKHTLAGMVNLPIKQALAAFPLDKISSYVIKKGSSALVKKLLGV